MGMNLTEYVTRKRLRKAIALVMNGKEIENFAYKSSFNSYTNFYKKFIKYYNQSPQSFFKRTLRENKKQ